MAAAELGGEALAVEESVVCALVDGLARHATHRLAERPKLSREMLAEAERSIDGIALLLDERDHVGLGAEHTRLDGAEEGLQTTTLQRRARDALAEETADCLARGGDRHQALQGSAKLSDPYVQ